MSNDPKAFLTEKARFKGSLAAKLLSDELKGKLDRYNPKDYKKSIDHVYKNFAKGVSNALKKLDQQGTTEPRQRTAAKKILSDAEEARKEVLDQVYKNAGLPTDNDRRVAFDNLWKNYVVPDGEGYADLPAKMIGSKDLELASSSVLDRSSSEQPITRLETALERGEFKKQEGFDHPAADITGKVGKDLVRASAELLPDESLGESKQMVLDISARLANPGLNIGPKTQQLNSAILNQWLVRRNKADSPEPDILYITIGELCELIGYKKSNGGFRESAINTVREGIKTLAHIQTSVLTPEINGERIKGSALAYTFEYYARNSELPLGSEVRDSWTALKISPNTYVRAIIKREGSLIMGANPAIKRLDAVKERAAVLLGRYLELQFRYNWNKTPGQRKLRVRSLLEEGMDLDLPNLSRKGQALDRLENALEKLIDQGVLKSYEFEPGYVDDKERAKITQHTFNRIIEYNCELEAGSEYIKFYKNLGLTYKGAPTLLPVVEELKGVLSSTELTQARVAEDIEVGRSTIAMWLNGKRAPDALRQEKLRNFLNNHEGTKDMFE